MSIMHMTGITNNVNVAIIIYAVLQMCALFLFGTVISHYSGLQSCCIANNGSPL